MNNHKPILLGALLLLVISNSCKKESDVGSYDCSAVVATYTGDIKTIMDKNCVSCHNSSSKGSGYDLSTYNSVKSSASSQAFLGSIEHRSGYDAMPKGGSKLSQTDIQKIYCWINSGAAQ
jgi:hypothetical protein